VLKVSGGVIKPVAVTWPDKFFFGSVCSAKDLIASQVSILTSSVNGIVQASVPIEQGYYDDVIFHRIINGFMCQGGDPEGSGRGGPGYKFADELPKPGKYQIGSLAMANAGPNTNGSQFFIVSGPSGCSLPPAYSLFGQVVKGLEVVEAMQDVATGSGDRPKTDVVIKSVAITVAD
jgi:cyclophilin family peptidyl-prolyl cis-trans isomerase